MANSVGTVAIDLEARIAQFESDLGRAARIADQQAAAMRKSLSTVAEVLGAGISIAGITAWVKSSLDAQDAISKLSQKVAVSTETLSGWELAAKQAGVENDALQKGLIKLGQSAALAADGSKLQVNAFKSIGVSVNDASGHLKSVETLFGQVADKISSYTDSTEKTVVATRLFGKAGADLIPLLNAGKQGLADYIKMADDFGLTVGSKSAKAAEEFNDSIEQLGFVSKGVANQIATALAPALADLAQKSVAFFRSQDWKGVLNDISVGATAVANHLGDIVNAVKLLGELVATVYASKMISAGVAWIGNLSAQGVAVDALGAKTALSLGATIKNVGLLQTSLNLAASALVGWQIGTYLYNQFSIVRDAGAILVGTLLTGWVRIKEGAELAWNGLEETWTETIFNMQSLWLKFANNIAATLQGSIIPAVKSAGDKMAQSLAESQDKAAGDALTKVIANQTARNKIISDANLAASKILTTTYTGMGAPNDNGANDHTLDTVTVHASAAAGAIKLVSDAAADAAKKLLEYQQKLADLQHAQDDLVAKYVNKIEPPDVQAWNAYSAALTAVNDNYEKQVNLAQTQQAAGVKGVNVAQVERDAQDQLSKSLVALGDAYDVASAAALKKKNVGDEMATQAIQQANSALLSARDQAIANAGLDAYNKLIAQGEDANGAFVASQKAIAEQGAATAYDLQQFAEQQKSVAQEYAGFWENASSSIAKSFGDLFTGQITNMRDFGASLKSIAQQLVSDMIAQFLRLRVIGPLLSGAMSTVGGLLGIAGQYLGGSQLSLDSQYYGGGSVVGTSAGSVTGSGGAAGSTQSYAGMVQNIQTLKSAYNYIFGGGSSSTLGFAPAGEAGGQVAIGTSPVYANTPYFGGSTSASLGGVPFASIGGGLLGAYYGAHQGGGGLGTVGSTVAYGAAGAAIAGTAAGVAGGASLGAAATGAFGAAAASTSWVPIVGWILAAAAIVDHFTGGKVFGTKFATAQSNVDLMVGPDGSSASASLDQWKYKGTVHLGLIDSLTGGLNEIADWGNKATRVVQQDVTPEMLAAAKQLYDSLEKAMVSGAQKLGVAVPPMIEAGITAQTTYDKKGKNTGTTYLVDYLGQTWKEATADLAAERLGADALVSVVSQSIGSAAQAIAQQFQSSADLLLDGANTMIEAQADINKGNSLLALGGSATLAQVIQFTLGLQQSGEALADTYERLMQASQAYLQFVGQFAPTSNTFGSSLEAIAKQMQANIDQANSLAIAAGLAGAKESDLANIHQAAAQQAADAIAQLTSSAADLAAKLYPALGGTLSQVNAQIDALTSKTQTAAQLAIGDNSPLSDTQKLQVALEGLRSGITSADDVLALGRKLYSSSADYTGLYNKVSEILQLPSATGTGSGSIDAALTDYNKLIAQRDQMQSQADATARFADAKTLAQYVADISTTHGIGYGEAASGLGFSLSDLAKDLGVTNISGYLDSLKLADIPGSTMDASASIVDAIQQLGHDLIATITGGPLVNPGPTGALQAAPSDPQTIALLQSINEQLYELNGHAGSTASNTATTAKQGATDALRNIQSSSRSTA